MPGRALTYSISQRPGGLAARAAASWPYLTLGAWIVGSILLFEATGIDVRLPCLVKWTFGVECPGCGLTRAAQALLRGDLAGAWASNPLVFLVLPAGFCYWLRGTFPACRAAGRRLRGRAGGNSSTAAPSTATA